MAIHMVTVQHFPFSLTFKGNGSAVNDRQICLSYMKYKPRCRLRATDLSDRLHFAFAIAPSVR